MESLLAVRLSQEVAHYSLIIKMMELVTVHLKARGG